MNNSLKDVARVLYGVPHSVCCKVCTKCKENKGNENLSCIDCIEDGLRILISKDKLRNHKYQEALNYLVDKYCDINYDRNPLNRDTEMVLRLQELVDKDIPNTDKFSYPNRQQLESLLGKKVKIKLCNKSVLTGELHKTGEEQFKNNSDLYCKPNYYFLLDENREQVDRLIFRVSYVSKAEVLENENN